MSPTNDTVLTLGFLNDAAHLLSKAAPETSALLMRHRNDMMFANDWPQTELHREHVCNCCGHIMVPGQGSTLKIESRGISHAKSTRSAKKHHGRRTQSSKPRGGASKVLSCENCGRFTKIPLPPPVAIQRKKKKTAVIPLATEPPAAGQYAAPSKTLGANASSKKRAKARKAGLQALLAQSNANKSSSLSLADFIKK